MKSGEADGKEMSAEVPPVEVPPVKLPTVEAAAQTSMPLERSGISGWADGYRAGFSRIVSARYSVMVFSHL